ncbi:MAG TPA: hypothetical protein VFH47_01940 [Candidatus Thermoplasmatota archaeon]|nr:hypothetical protein [Candidatus Thermoplasmatota archaeon]
MPAAPYPAAPAPPPSGGARWSLPHYVVRERRLSLGRQYEVLDPSGALVAYCKQKMFRLREDIRFYTDRTQAVELFRLQATKVLDFNAVLQVIDSATGQVVGGVGRRGWKSMLRDHWRILDRDGRVVGAMLEHGSALSVLRRFIGALAIVPHKYELLSGPEGSQRPCGEIQERFQLFGDTYDLRFDPKVLDGRVAIALAVCADAMEGE